MYDYGSAEDNMKHYGVVSERVCWEGGGEYRVCVGRVVESAVRMLGGGGECRWCGRVVVSVACVIGG